MINLSGGFENIPVINEKYVFDNINKFINYTSVK